MLQVTADSAGVAVCLRWDCWRVLLLVVRPNCNCFASTWHMLRGWSVVMQFMVGSCCPLMLLDCG